MFLSTYLNRDIDVKRFKTRGHYLPKDIIQHCNVIINGKTFYDQPIDSDIKWYVGHFTRKLTTGQGGDYTIGCLLNYKFLINNYRLITIDLSRQK